jgi:hypothetical protein
LCPEHRQRIILAAERGHLEIYRGRPELRRGTVSQFTQQPRLTDSADACHIEYAGAGADSRKFRSKIC